MRWITTTRGYIPEIDRDVELAPRQAYFYNGHTRPDMRGRGIDGAAKLWREARAIQKLTLPIRWVMPSSLRGRARRLLRLPSSELPEFLDYDLRALRQALEARGLACEIRDFLPDYWNSEFRASRSNLIISIPARRDVG